MHRLDAARLYRLALEKGVSGARYHAVTEEGVPLRQIAEAIGQGLGVPTASLTAEEAGDHFGWLALPAGMDAHATSVATSAELGWRPTGQPDFVTDLQNSSAF